MEIYATRLIPNKEIDRTATTTQQANQAVEKDNGNWSRCLLCMKFCCSAWNSEHMLHTEQYSKFSWLCAFLYTTSLDVYYADINKYWANNKGVFVTLNHCKQHKQQQQQKQQKSWNWCIILDVLPLCLCSYLVRFSHYDFPCKIQARWRKGGTRKKTAYTS